MRPLSGQQQTLDFAEYCVSFCEKNKAQSETFNHI